MLSKELSIRMVAEKLTSWQVKAIYKCSMNLAFTRAPAILLSTASSRSG
jgi:hypothetical protein